MIVIAEDRTMFFEFVVGSRLQIPRFSPHLKKRTLLNPIQSGLLSSTLSRVSGSGDCASTPPVIGRELTNRRLLHDDAVGLRDISTAHAHLGTCRRRDKVDDVGESDLPASWKQQDVSSIGDGVTGAFSKLRSIWISHLHYFFPKMRKLK